MMRKTNISLLCVTLAVSTSASAGWLDFLNQTEDAAETVQNTTTTINNTVKAGQAVSDIKQAGLVETLVKQLGVSETQAKGGSGALFQMAKDKMSAPDFAQLSQSVPGMDGMLSAVPQQKPASTTTSLLTGLANVSGNNTLTQAASLLNTFQQLDMSKGMVQQFTPIVIDYVKKNAGEITANALQSALTGL